MWSAVLGACQFSILASRGDGPRIGVPPTLHSSQWSPSYFEVALQLSFVHSTVSETSQKKDIERCMFIGLLILSTHDLYDSKCSEMTPNESLHV